MKRHALGLFATVGGLLLAIPGFAAGHPRDVQAVAANYNDVAAQLDRGGDLYIVANMEGALESGVAQLTELCAALPAGPEAGLAKQTLSRVAAFLGKQGFYSVNGVGLSVVPRADGRNAVRLYVGRDEADAGRPLWRALVGGPAQRQACLGFLPADTVLVRSGTGDPKALWSLVRDGVREIGTTNAAAIFDGLLAAQSMRLGTTVDALVASLGEESFISLQLSSQETVTIPSGATPLTVPSPALLLATAVRDATLHDFILTQLTNSGLPLVQTTVGAAKLETVPMPLPLPFPLQPTLALHRNFLLFGSTSNVVKQAIEAADGGGGLTATPEFQKAFAGLAMTNNGITYLSPRFGGALAAFQKQALASAPGKEAQALQAALGRMLSEQGYQACAMVIVNLPSGILSAGNSTSGGREMLASVAVAPMAMLSAIAIPSFVKARSTSQLNACRNNLRILDSAKEQWALETSTAEGADVDLPAMLKFIKGERLPVCPQGGRYTVGPIGTKPTCSNPAHHL